jgi:hypothetical protein
MFINLFIIIIIIIISYTILNFYFTSIFILTISNKNRRKGTTKI